MARFLTKFLTVGLESLFGMARLPAPISYPLLFISGILMQSIGLICQAARWLAKGCRRHGQGDTRVLRMLEERFEGLDAYPFAPHYFEHDGIRLHFVDEGPKDASDVVVLIHGMPAWSYCYRKVIPVLVSEGHRVLALDFCGCGKSDKPIDASKITFSSHVASISALVAHIKITQPKITLVIHDWGSLIGQTALPMLDGVLKRLVILNAFAGPNLFGTMKGRLLFNVWQGLVRIMGRAIPAGELNAADAGGPSVVSAAAEAGYCAPFPDADYKGLMANWPLAYNDKSGVVKAYAAALAWIRESLKVPVLVAFGQEDLILELEHAYTFFKGWMKSALSVERVAISGAGHFPMESHDTAVTAAIINFMRATCCSLAPGNSTRTTCCSMALGHSRAIKKPL